jgi:hypothetical protein
MCFPLLEYWNSEARGPREKFYVMYVKIVHDTSFILKKEGTLIHKMTGFVHGACRGDRSSKTFHNLGGFLNTPHEHSRAKNRPCSIQQQYGVQLLLFFTGSWAP